MSVAEYLDHERSQEICHELVDGYLYAMGGASERHERLAMNIAAALSVHLRDTPCRVFKGDLKIAVGDDHYYPDVFVACGPSNPEGYSRDDPVVIVEVLSPSTRWHDTGDKRLACANLSTLEEYVLAWQDRERVEIRTIEDDSVRVLETSDSVLRLESLDVAMTLADLHA